MTYITFINTLCLLVFLWGRRFELSSWCERWKCSTLRVRNKTRVVTGLRKWGKGRRLIYEVVILKAPKTQKRGTCSVSSFEAQELADLLPASPSYSPSAYVACHSEKVPLWGALARFIFNFTKLLFAVLKSCFHLAYEPDGEQFMPCIFEMIILALN